MVTSKRGQRPKLQDVADLAETSLTTASRVLNDKGFVSADIRARVLQAAETLNYRPNLQAKALRQQAGHSIGLVIPNLLNPYYIALADKVSDLLAGSGYYLLLSATRDEPATQEQMLYDLLSQNIAGLIWVPTIAAPKLLDEIHQQNIPAVALVRRVAEKIMDTVVFEDYQGSCVATQHLLNLGHTRIAYIAGDISHSSNNARWHGYLTTLKKAGLTVDDHLAKLGMPRRSWGKAATLDLLNLAEPPTAIFAASNPVVPGIIRALQYHGVRVPDDISLICFDDLEWFSFFDPPLSAISVSHDRLAQLAVELLMRRVKDSEGTDRPPVFMEIDFNLVVRGSTSVPRSQPLTLRTTGFNMP
jgi:DNA-binding LacI/PurR family transcriptional regulator